MIVYGLSGKAGTGKSYNATELCGRRGIEAMVDDGLFIMGGKLIAGESAKKQPTKIGAVKAALFADEEKRSAVSGAIAEKAPESLLILGTSDEMVSIIADHLGVPQPSEYIHIEDITTPEQRRMARENRDLSGLHAIPVPTMQVKKNFSGYLLGRKRSFGKSSEGEGNIEKTVVRPTYSYLGDFVISNKVIADIVRHTAKGISGIADILWVVSDNSDEGLYVRIIMQAEENAAVMTAATELQRRSYEAIAQMTAFNMLGVEVEIHSYKKAG